MPNLSQRGAVHLLVPLILLVGIGAGVYLTVTGNLKLFSKATNPAIVFKSSSGQALTNNSSGIPQTTSPTVKIELTSTLGAPVFQVPQPSDIPTPQPEPQAPEPSAQTSPVGVGTTGSTLGEATSSVQVSGTALYKLAENPTDLDKASDVSYVSHPTVLDYTFKDPNPGTKFIWVEFKDVSGKVDRQTAQIELVSASSCTPCSADVSGKKDSQGNIVPDGYINGADASAVIGRGCFNKTTADKDKFSRQCSYLDANGDGKIDMADLNCIKSQFLKKCEARPTPIASSSPTPTPQAAMRVFVTSTRYTGNLGGLQGADDKCQLRANVANLGGTWHAWLSDSTTSAASRMNQNASPYKLLDGTVIADDWKDLTDGTLKKPIVLDELGKTSQGGNLHTNTTINGSIHYSSPQDNCSNWTSETSGTDWSAGWAGYTDARWTEMSQGIWCKAPLPLYCFEFSSDTRIVPIPTPTPTPIPVKKVFVSSTSTWGNLGGLDGADAKCQTDARNRGFGGIWKAWLSSSIQSVSARFTHNNGPYKLMDGTVIADNWADLTDGYLKVPINKDIYGNNVGYREIWTNTLPSGEINNTPDSFLGNGPDKTSCRDWTSRSSSDFGRTGGTAFSDNRWTRGGSQDCPADGWTRLYCFEQ